MPRRRDILCAGTCGQLIWRGKGALPEGESMCRPCRAAHRTSKPEPGGICLQCGGPTPLGSQGRPRRACSDVCRRKIRIGVGERVGAKSAGRAKTVIEKPCFECGAITASRSSRSLCDACRQNHLERHNRAKNLLRRGVTTSSGRCMTVAELAARDCWTCHLCRK